jgi:hypothetical protein
MSEALVRFSAALAICFLCACTTPYTNTPTEDIDKSPRTGSLRTTFKVDGQRGNPRVLTYLSLSGGGSRSAYFSAATMLNLQTAFNDIDLLEEVDVISAVSGGAMAAAYYVGSQDLVVYEKPLVDRIKPLIDDTPLSKKISIVDGKTGAIRCSDRLTETEKASLTQNLTAFPKSLGRLVQLCETRSTSGLRNWDPKTVRGLMAKNYLLPWFGRWFLPQNFVPYWFSSRDRSDIMADVFASNMYSQGILNSELRMSDLNPSRPFLILNATSATQREKNDPIGDTDPPFGAVFTFTEEDFLDRLGSRIDEYSLARAVMGSSAFPLVFQNMTLADFRKNHSQHCDNARTDADPCSEQRYLHIFDGGNSDNLGLHSVKRSILQMAVNGRLGRDYDAVVVILVDAITQSKGANRFEADPRGLVSLIADLNVTDAVDALLKANHDKIIRDFSNGILDWEMDCLPESRNLPLKLCDELKQKKNTFEPELRTRMIFFHIGFEDIGRVHRPDLSAIETRSLEDDANKISTSFQLGHKSVRTLENLANNVVASDNSCLISLRVVFKQEKPTSKSISEARNTCKESVPTNQ